MTIRPGNGQPAAKFNDTCGQCLADQPIVFVIPKDESDDRGHTWTCVSCGAALRPTDPRVYPEPAPKKRN